MGLTIKAKDLLPGHEFKTKNGRKFRMVSEIYSRDLSGDVVLIYDNCKQIFIPRDEELILDESCVMLPEVFLANSRMEPKEQAVESVSYIHYPYVFHPCAYLTYWIRWGKFIFDIREVRDLFGAAKTSPIDLTVGQANFTLKIEDMLAMIGEESFPSVLLRVYKKKPDHL